MDKTIKLHWYINLLAHTTCDHLRVPELVVKALEADIPTLPI